MVQYSSSIGQQAANMLYRQADDLIRNAQIWGGLRGAVLGAIAAAVAGAFISEATSGTIYLIVGGIAGAIAGVMYGTYAAQREAFLLRFLAQQILVVAQIEKNTHDMLHEMKNVPAPTPKAQPVQTSNSGTTTHVQPDIRSETIEDFDHLPDDAIGYAVVSQTTDLRRDPSADAQVLGKLSKGEKLLLLDGGTGGQWVKVRKANSDKIRWVDRAYVSVSLRKQDTV